jgi:hypothetical protein
MENFRLENLREEIDHDKIDVQTLHIFKKAGRVHVGGGHARDLFLVEPSPGIELRFNDPYRFGLA